MNTVFQDYNARKKEVDGYFDFVIAICDHSIIFSEKVESAVSLRPLDDELIKTMKASCYLLLYNLVESSMRNAVEAIFEDLKVNKTNFDECRQELKLEILKNFRNRNPDKLVNRLNSMACDVIHETFASSEIFAGNIDAREIRKTAKRYGFEPPVGCQFSLLLNIKNIRNDLAHGVKSFVEVGRDSSQEDLKNARKQTFDILDQTLKNIDTYLCSKCYLANSSS